MPPLNVSGWKGGGRQPTSQAQVNAEASGANFEGTLPPTLRSRVKKPRSFQLKNGDKQRRSLEMRRPRGPMYKHAITLPLSPTFYRER